mmetsp:Transcript_39607/g.53843  ORF Transcript_39607/g.53843 Transcript_39607/m.53843 type:complete len:518 (-) Transcript_39607:200-1753(-)
MASVAKHPRLLPDEPDAKRSRQSTDRQSSGGEGGASDSLISLPVQFTTVDGAEVGPRLDLPIAATQDEMERLVNKLTAMQTPDTGKRDAEVVPYAFYVEDHEVTGSVAEMVSELKLSTETVLTIRCEPLAVFRVRPMTRCGATMPGHQDAVLHVSYSPDSNHLASASADCVVRFWDVSSSLPRHICRGHTSAVLFTSWAPDARRLATADLSGEIRLWNPITGKAIGSPLRGHKKWVTSMAWEPVHRSTREAERFVSASKDATLRIWNARTGRMEASLSSHCDSVEAVRWGGAGFIYSASRDRTIKVWAADGRDEVPGKLVRTLSGHGHRVNTLALSSEYVCKSGAFDHTGQFTEPQAEAAQARYDVACGGEAERLVSGSDDNSLILWQPSVDKKPLARMTGHQQVVNHIAFSPDGRFLASASFDKKVKIWSGRTGVFIATLTGHVGRVYQVAWSSDSRMVASASADSTVKIWEVRQPKTAKCTLPGHEDEVYALDWSPDGGQVASGSKDRKIKIWRN